MPSLLPYNLQDENNLALEECMNKAFNIDMTKFLTAIVDNLSDEVLYEKAKMFHVLGSEGFKDAKTRNEKEYLIKNSINMHRKKGTVFAVKSRLFGDEITYTPYWKYNGLPNHFKLSISTQDVIDLTTYNRISTAINEYKRLSAKLDVLEIKTMIQDELNLTGNLLLSRRILVC